LRATGGSGAPPERRFGNFLSLAAAGTSSLKNALK